MTAVLVHGVPETPRVWEPLLGHLRAPEVVTLQLPGFGSGRPDGFAATKEAYVEWLADELERLQGDGPVDLVGHDWGGGLVVRLVSTRVELVRSWVTDAAGIAHPDFEWHEFAKIWQTPGEGEAFFADQLAQSVAERSAVFEMFGVPAAQTGVLGESVDATMAACILDLYRSATDVGRQWAPDFHDIAAPGLVVLASEDPFLSERTARRAAVRAGARLAELPGLGHWWMLEDPAAGATVLEEFWGTLD